MIAMSMPFDGGTSDFTFCLDLDYIVKWVQPAGSGEYYSFWICPAQLSFKNIEDVLVNLDWTGLAPDCQIQDIRRHSTRTTPNGNVQWFWEVELLEPSGSISLWATGFELSMTGPSTLSKAQRMREE